MHITQQRKKMAKLWQRKGTALNRQIEEFCVGNEHIIDQKLVKHDCIASIAHAKALQKAGIIKSSELKKLTAGLNEIISLDRKGKFRIKPEQEDCHTAIENHLTKKLGYLGKKIHTGRSRNDQVIAALRLYEKDELAGLQLPITKLISVIKKFGGRTNKIPIPGYTHLRKAMPYTVGKWAEAFAESLQEDLLLLKAANKLIDQNPLGSAAGYGVPVIDIDRKLTAKLLGFSKVQNNTLYVQNSRGKFELFILHALNQVMLDLNKLATDIWLYTTDEFGYFSLPKEFSLGSSIMPHKANPDIVEIVRAKTAMFRSCCDAISSIITGLPSGYNGDFKLTKEPFISGVESAKSCISIMAVVMSGLNVDAARCRAAMTPELYTTEKALGLVKKGMAFRDAYRKVADENK